MAWISVNYWQLFKMCGMSLKDHFRFVALQETKDFLEEMDRKSRKKVLFNIWKCKTIKDLFKHLNGEIWEFRTYYNKAYIRIFAF